MSAKSCVCTALLIFISNSSSLTLTDDGATGNSGLGMRIVKSPPYQSVGDVLADGNTASGNDDGDIFVQAQNSSSDDESPCGPAVATVTPTPTPTPRATATPAKPTSTTRPSATPPAIPTPTFTGPRPTATLSPIVKTTPTPTARATVTPVPTATPGSGPTTPAQWRFYVQITQTSGGTVNVNVPLRASDPPLTIAIAPDQIASFGLNAHKTEAQISAFGGDTLARLRGGVAAYLAGHPADYPTAAGLVQLNWASRVGP